MNNLLPYCGLVEAKIRASDKDLPEHRLSVILTIQSTIKAAVKNIQAAAYNGAPSILPIYDSGGYFQTEKSNFSFKIL
jgi:hypothetical protein